MTALPSLYDRIGPELVRQALTEFYRRAFSDMVIGHFFVGRDREHLTEQQIAFATAMLGGPRNYRGKPLGAAHRSLPLRPPHFGRRQVLMAEVLADVGLAPDLAAAWLALEEALRPLLLSRS